MSANFANLLLHPRTRAEAELFLARPANALLVIGQPGSGKATLVESLSKEILKTTRLDDYPYFLRIIRPEGKQDIPIENVRAVLRSLRLRTPGKEQIRRIVFIEDAPSLSTEAQNALLKAIEEPASDTAFILSTSTDRAVLPTIASRMQRLQVHPVTVDQAKDYFQDQAGTAVEGAWQLAQGSTGLMHALLTNSQDHPLKDAVNSAKELLHKNSYERLLELDRLSKDKEQFNLFITALGKVLAALHRATLTKDNPRQILLLADRRLIQKMQDAMAANTSTRLVALELALNLKV